MQLVFVLITLTVGQIILSQRYCSYFHQIIWEPFAGGLAVGLNTDNSGVYRYLQVSSNVLLLSIRQTLCPQLLTYYYSLDVSTMLLSLLFLVVISYLSTAQEICFITVCPHTSVAFCGWHKVLSLSEYRLITQKLHGVGRTFFVTPPPTILQFSTRVV